MRINLINNCNNNISTNNIQKSRNITPRFITPLKQDTISFTGRFPTNKNIETATKLGTEIFATLVQGGTKKDVPKIISKYTPITQTKIHPIEDLENILGPEAKNYCAYSTFDINDTFTPAGQSLYLNMTKPAQHTMQKLGFAMDTAHEVTHLLQSGEDGVLDEYKTLANGDSKYAKTIASIGDCIFKSFDYDLKLKHTKHFFNNPIDIFESQMLGMIVPKEKPVNAKSIYGITSGSREEFSKNMSNTFDYLFYGTMKNIAENPQNAPKELIENLIEIGSKPNGIQKFMEDTRKYCAISARKEKEATIVESNVVKKTMGKQNTSLNIDAFPIYYSMLEDSFKKVNM